MRTDKKRIYPFNVQAIQEDSHNFFRQMNASLLGNYIAVQEDWIGELKERWRIIETHSKRGDAPPWDFQIMYTHLDYSRTDHNIIIGEVDAAKKLGIEGKFTSMIQTFPYHHPKQLPFHHILAKAMLILLTGNKYQKHIHKTRHYSCDLALRFPDGHYYLVHVMRVPLMFDEQPNNLSVVMNYYHKRGRYQGEPLSPRLEMEKDCELSGEEIIAALREIAVEYLRKDYKQGRRKFLFSDMEMTVLKVFFENPTFTNKEVGEKIYRGEEAVKSINKNIFRKARELFPRNFNRDEHKTKDVAEYWVNQGLAL